MVWVKQFLDVDYESAWKFIEMEMLKLFHDDPLMLWKSEAPQCVMNQLKKIVK